MNQTVATIQEEVEATEEEATVCRRFPSSSESSYASDRLDIMTHGGVENLYFWYSKRCYKKCTTLACGITDVCAVYS